MKPCVYEYVADVNYIDKNGKSRGFCPVKLTGTVIGESLTDCMIKAETYIQSQKYTYDDGEVINPYIQEITFAHTDQPVIV